MTSGRIISIINHKGGVGKTTTAVNLGEALARAGLHVLVIDLDAQCNSTHMLLPGGTFQYTAFDVLNPDQDKLDPELCAHATHQRGLDCLPNRHDSLYLEPQLIAMGPAGFQLLRSRLQPYLRERYDLTLIDNPPNFGTFVASALLTSDFVVIPCDAGSAASLRGFSKALQFIDEIRENGNPTLQFLKGLITKVDRRTSVWKTLVDAQSKLWGDDWVFKTFIPMNTDFQKAEYLDRTIFQIKANTPGGVAYSELAKELLAVLDEVIEAK